MGAGGNWFKSTLNLELLENKKYINFHGRHQKNDWIRISHITEHSESKLIFSGTAYFNFFVNLIYKHYYYVHNLFEITDYEHYWMTIVAASFEICQYDKFSNNLNFNFDDLISNPTNFYNATTNLQKLSNKPTIKFDDFLYRRKKFIDSCVNISDMTENFNNMIWVAFVLGQLMIYKIHPSFSIADFKNQDLCKQFAQENYHHCQLKNFINFDTQIFLPKFKNL
jgi:hypothetical protein